MSSLETRAATVPTNQSVHSTTGKRSATSVADGEMKQGLLLEAALIAAMVLRGVVRRRHPARSQESAAAAREGDLQPVLRTITRTRTTFEIAAKRLSADVINLTINVSSQSKGESVLDTVANLSAMQADMFIVRHARAARLI